MDGRQTGAGGFCLRKDRRRANGGGGGGDTQSCEGCEGVHAGVPLASVSFSELRDPLGIDHFVNHKA